MPTNIPEQVDVAVIGGGPSGATASTLIAQNGHKVHLFEREHFPRFHIGESLIPETYWVLQRLNMLEKLKQSAFIKKHSVQFVSQNGKLSEPFYFWDNKPHECSQTWQVLRSEFDHMMLNNAREHGVGVHEGVRVLDVLFEGERAAGLKLQTEDGATHQVRAKVVIDASGQSSLIANRCKIRVMDPDLKKGALWTYWEGAYRDTGRDEGATLVCHTKGKKGWFWYIPLHNNIISVGVVSSFEYLFNKQRGTNHEKIYNEELDLCPVIKERCLMGRRVAGFYATKDYSYKATHASGDGWVLVGDAFGFLDPLYSSGVLMALKSGQLAADAISEGLSKGDTSAAQIGKWEPEFRTGMDRMRRLVCEFYDGFSFGRFVRKHPHTKGHLTDMLIGDVFTEKTDYIVPLIDEMRDEMKTVTTA
jgi:flavin-dependent dehydrogenase